MVIKKPLDKIVLSDILVKDIEFSDEEPVRSEQLLEFVRVASLQCVNALLRIRPIVVSPLPRGKWKILAGHSSFLVAKAFAQLSDTVTVLAVPDEGDAAKMIPIVDTLFSHMLNSTAPVEEVWDRCARDPLFVALGRDLNHPRVRGMLASKKVPRKYGRAKAQGVTTAEQPTGAADIDSIAVTQSSNGPDMGPPRNAA